MDQIVAAKVKDTQNQNWRAKKQTHYSVKALKLLQSFLQHFLIFFTRVPAIKLENLQYQVREG
jgi:hypothetical protein